MGISEIPLSKKCECGGEMFLRNTNDNRELLTISSPKKNSLFMCELCPIVESYEKVKHPEHYAKPIRNGTKPKILYPIKNIKEN